MPTKLVALWRTPVRRPLLAATATVGSLALLSGTASAYPTNPATIWTIAGNGSHCASSTTTCGDGTSATSAQLNEPNGVAVDGAGNVWVAITSGAAEVSSSGTALSPGGGFVQSDSGRMQGIGIDPSGNVWMSDAVTSRMTELVGAAAPVKTPIFGPPNRH